MRARVIPETGYWTAASWAARDADVSSPEDERGGTPEPVRRPDAGPRVLLLLPAPLDPATRRLIATLTSGGWTVRTPARSELDRRPSSHDAAAILFDPGILGPERVMRLRRDNPELAIIGWLSSPSSTQAAALIEAGADEVLSGAMGERELAVRATRALRRRGTDPPGPLTLGDLTLDPVAAEVRWAGRELELTRRERALLSVLAASVGRTLRREAIHRAVWGHAMARGDRTVDVTVSRLRRKLAAAGAAVEIVTQPGVGYRLVAPPAGDP
jgi:two-component system, OmpR family, response regulator